VHALLFTDPVRYFHERYCEESQASFVAGKAEAILIVLDSRGLTASPEQREQILGGTDAATLDSLLRRAVDVTSTKQLLA
jgi:hypothetical protein